MTPDTFVRQVSAIQFENVFNPYSDRCAVYDTRDAPRRRRRALGAILRAASDADLDSIWIGRDLGYRGGRRTGLALTDDVHVAAHAGRWGIEFERPTKGAAVSERTAAVIWRVLSQINSPLFLWNVFPFHPHIAENCFSNRAHNSVERRKGEEILAELYEILKPRRLIAIGNDAASCAARISNNFVQVRHPSYGGQREFFAQIQELYSIPVSSEQLPLFV